MSTGASKRSLSDLKDLLEHQNEIKNWLQLADQRIYELEELYLESTPLGNIIRGWEIDGKPLSNKPRTIDDKERLFSNSSFQIFMDSKILPDKSIASKNDSNPKKKARRSSTSKKGGIEEDWDADY